MASKIEFVEFMADQLKEAGTITYKKCSGNTAYTVTERSLP